MAHAARGQIAIEFIIMFGFAAIIGLLFLLSANTLFAGINEDQRRTAIDEVGYAIQDEIILATTVQDGYQRTILVPERADRFTYTLTSTATAVRIASGTTIITYTHPPIIGQIQKGRNLIAKDGNVTVTQ